MLACPWWPGQPTSQAHQYWQARVTCPWWRVTASHPAPSLTSRPVANERVMSLISLEKPGIGGSVVPVTGRTTKAIAPPLACGNMWWLALITPGGFIKSIAQSRRAIGPRALVRSNHSRLKQSCPPAASAPGASTTAHFFFFIFQRGWCWPAHGGLVSPPPRPANTGRPE